MKLGEICLRRRVIVLADEIHCDWVTKGQKYTPFSTLPRQGHRQQQHHLQGGEQVVRAGRDEARVDVLGQRGPDRAREGEPSRRPQHAGDGGQQGRLYGRGRGLAQSGGGVHRRQPRFRREVHRREHAARSRSSSRRAPICAGSTSPASPRRSARSSKRPKPTAARRRARRTSRPRRWSSATSSSTRRCI